MSAGLDLTRWNRAGLARFRYLDANAVDFLERLRGELAGRFPGWEPIQTPPGETDDQRRERMARQYEEVRTDWGWEIARAFARACHVLGEHLDAYANEGYLRTATQWDSVRKLVAMLDVYPAPPASASTPLAIEAKEEPGTLAAGFAVRHSPKDGGAPVAFGTLEDLAVDPALNALRLAGWNLSPAPLIDLPPPRPLSAIAQRSAIVIEGIGPEYRELLDAHAPLGSGFFKVADFRALNPAPLRGAVLRPGKARSKASELRLWEAKSKAEVLLDFPWTAGELAPSVRLMRLPELLSQTTASLAAKAGRTAADMERLLEDLRAVEAALDEGVFTATQLADLLSPGAVPVTPPPLWLAPEKSGISAGQLALVVRAEGSTEEAAVVTIARVAVATSEITLAPVAHQPAFERWTRGVSSLLAKPEVIAVAHLAGTPNSLTFAEPHGLSVGDAVAWQSGTTWSFATVTKADDLSLLLSGSARPAAGTEVFRPVEVVRDAQGLFLPLGYRAAAAPTSGGFQVLGTGDRAEVKDTPPAGTPATVRLFSVTRANTDRVVFVPGGATAAGRVAAVAPSAGDGKFRFDGKPGKLASGQWVVGDDGSRLLALRIARIEELEDLFAVTFESVVEPAPSVAGQPVSILMGVGPEISAALNQANLRTVGALAAALPSRFVSGVTRTSFIELRAKARLVTGFPFAETDLEPVLDQTVPQVLGMTKAALADQLGKPDEWAAELLEKLRLMQAVIDEPPLVSLRIRDLLPIGAPQPVQGYTLTRLDRLYGVFAHTIRPSGWDRNDTPAAGSLVLELAPPVLLAHGRRLLLERAADDGTSYAREATVLTAGATDRSLELDPPLLADEGFTFGNLVIHANVVRAGHGESKPAKVLGSGDAARLSQSFVLKEKNVAFVADPTQPAGVAAAVTVTVAGQIWRQVATLRDSRPTDAHYEVRLTEDGFLAFTFGDGRHGRRLPTGTNNVRVSFRVGTGLAGNLPPGRLTKPARPHPLVAAVSQLLDATGGNDREDVASLKAQAPTSVLTLDRAVSLSDFAALAARQASVWQARAFALPTGGGRHASLEVVVVPAGGGPLGPLAADLESFLVTNAVPGVDLRVSPYEPRPFDLEVDIEVKGAEFDSDEVRKSVEAALLDAFSLRRRALGADLFASEVYEVVEAVRGVESSRAIIGGDPIVRLLPATERQVIFLDPASSRLTVNVEEFEL
ncbi:MAG TPA: baseplate J/gp47 family protein [Thermoanaerobaculia bacterium]|jgi:hypothetical protein|nr:baseplate J/gp47 family protein [Thermoanaerobaculia bacterium]